jgi:hypothetical protein
MKYAQLPDGRKLEFPDNAPAKAMSKAVRRELGLVSGDILDEITTVARKVENTTDQPHVALEIGNLSRILQGLLDQSVKTGEALNVAVKSIEASNKASINSSSALYKGLQDVIEHSTEAIQADLKMTMRAISTVNATMQGLLGISKTLVETVDTLKKTAKLSKRARRMPDGSWTMEVIDEKVNPVRYS